MSKYIIKDSPIEGLISIQPAELGLSREYLFEPMSEESLAEFSAMGIAEEEQFIEHIEERFARGVLRGLHFQRENPYSKLISVKSGRILAVAVDMRPESVTFGASHSVELTAENEVMFYVPKYFAFGFMTLEPATEVIFNFAGEYNPKAESGIIYDDEVLAINWQFERYEIDEKYLNLTQRDKKNKSFRMYNQHDLWPNRPKRSKYAIRY